MSVIVMPIFGYKSPNSTILYVHRQSLCDSLMTINYCKYDVYGISLETGFPFPELRPAARGRRPVPGVQFAVAPREAGHSQVTWDPPRLTPSGTVWARTATAEEPFLVEFPDLATFDLDARGGRIVARPVDGVPVRTIRHLLLDAVLPMYLHERGDLVLHGNGVVHGGRSGILLLGPAQAGKSTAAAALCAAGCALLADDCLRIARRRGRLVGMPGYPGLRLWADSTAKLLDRTTRLRAGRSVAHYAPHKRVIAGMALASAPVRLARVYVLDGPSVVRRGTSSDITIERVGGSAAIELLLPHLFRLRTGSMRRLERELHHLTTLAHEVPVRRLRYPRRWSALRHIDAAIAADLAICDS